MSFLSFAKNLLIDPIGLSKVYFKRSKKEPLLQAQAFKVYFLIPILSTVMYVCWFLLHLFLMRIENDTEMPLSWAFNTIVGKTLAWVIPLGVLMIISLLPLVMATIKLWLDVWKMRIAIRLIGSEMSYKEAHALAIYMMAFEKMLLFVFLIQANIASVVMNIDKGMGKGGMLTFLYGIFLLISIPIILIRKYYVWYKLLKTWGRISGLKAVGVMLINTFLLVLFLFLVFFLLGFLAVLLGNL